MARRRAKRLVLLMSCVTLVVSGCLYLSGLAPDGWGADVARIVVAIAAGYVGAEVALGIAKRNGWK